MIEPVKLSIFYCNDIHGNSDQMAGMVTAAQQFKLNSLDKDTFVLSAGDNYSGADDKKNDFILDIMQNMMGVELSAVGNHELDAASDGFFTATDKKKVGFVATNVKLGSNNLMQRNVKKSIVKEKNGVKYGFVGAMPIDFDAVSKEVNRKDIKVMSFEDSVNAIQSEVDKLKSQGIDKIIMLSHSGYDTDKKYAQSLDGVDIIIGGHTHTVVNDAKIGENVVTSKSGEPVLITQAGENAKYYGITNVEFQNGILSKVQNNLMESPAKVKSPIIEYIKDIKLGKSPKVTTIGQIDPMPKNRRISPCPWTNLMADSMREHFKTDIAIVNAANIRKVPQPGILTERDVSESAPMKNDLLKTTVSEKQLVDAIQNACKKTLEDKEGKPGLLIPSGFSYKINTNGDLLEMKIGDNKIDINNPAQKLYSATYDIFVAKKGGEYPELYPAFDVERFTYDKDKTTIEYLKGKDRIDVVDDGRVHVVKPLNVLV